MTTEDITDRLGGGGWLNALGSKYAASLNQDYWMISTVQENFRNNLWVSSDSPLGGP